MLKSELEVGMKVRANEKSNKRYGITKKSRNCEGIVKRIHSDNSFTLEITNHDSVYEIGSTYEVNPEYFDKVEAVAMVIEVKKIKINVGDLVITDKGSHILIFRCDSRFRGIVLDKEKVTSCVATIEKLEVLINREYGKVVRVVPASNLKIAEI